VPSLLRQFLHSVTSLGFITQRWRLPCFVALGLLGGMGLLVTHVSRATSYLSDEPETCMNCHVMGPQYVTWQHSSHAGVATCNDCHVPHDSFLAHYGFKAKDGLWHATVFTMRWEPQVIRLSSSAIGVVENNCRRCHQTLIDEVHLTEHQHQDLRCWECHRDVPHGTVRSLSAVPSVFQPRLRSLGESDRQPEIGGRAARRTKDQPSKQDHHP